MKKNFETNSAEGPRLDYSLHFGGAQYGRPTWHLPHDSCDETNNKKNQHKKTTQPKPIGRLGYRKFYAYRTNKCKKNQ